MNISPQPCKGRMSLLNMPTIVNTKDFILNNLNTRVERFKMKYNSFIRDPFAFNSNCFKQINSPIYKVPPLMDLKAINTKHHNYIIGLAKATTPTIEITSITLDWKELQERKNKHSFEKSLMKQDVQKGVKRRKSMKKRKLRKLNLKFEYPLPSKVFPMILQHKELTEKRKNSKCVNKRKYLSVKLF